MKWTKATEKMPGDSPQYHFRLNGRKVQGNFYTDCEGVSFFEVRGFTHEPYIISANNPNLEWLDETDESPSSDPAEIELPFMDAREWSDADKAKLVEETMRLSAAPIMNTMAMLGINNLMRCEVVNHATGDEYIFSFQRKETKPDPAEVLVKALESFRDGYDHDTDAHKYNNKPACIVCSAEKALAEYEQLKNK